MTLAGLTSARRACKLSDDLPLNGPNPMTDIHDPRVCALGEGPLWHPLREQLFWFDILGKRLLTVDAGTPTHWQFDENVSAAGWIDKDTLLIASETALLRFDIEKGTHQRIVPLDANNPATRSNDGRADAWGGFWIGTMGKQTEPDAGAIYRFYKGEIRQLYAPVSVANSICFAPDRGPAYYTDTRTRRIMRQALDQETGWPRGAPETFVDLRAERLNPDGSVVDSEGCVWNAQWGAGRVARYAPDGVFLSAVEIPASQATCPAFGGADLKALYITSAADKTDGPHDGKTFVLEQDIAGQPEHQVIL